MNNKKCNTKTSHGYLSATTELKSSNLTSHSDCKCWRHSVGGLRRDLASKRINIDETNK